MTAPGAPCWSFCLSLHPTLSNLDRPAHAYELKDALDGLWAVRPLRSLAFRGALESDQISTNGHGGRLWVSANEPRDVQFTLPAAQEDS
jgi:hypothetical protein